MNTFNDYMLSAIKRQNLTSNNHLARELGITNASVSALYKGRALPAETTMIKIAELAGMPKEEALIDLNLWRSKDNPEVAKIWTRVAKMIGKTTLVALFVLSIAKPSIAKDTLPFLSSDLYQANIHYATNISMKI